MSLNICSLGRKHLADARCLEHKTHVEWPVHVSLEVVRNLGFVVFSGTKNLNYINNFMRYSNLMIIFPRSFLFLSANCRGPALQTPCSVWRCWDRWHERTWPTSREKVYCLGELASRTAGGRGHPQHSLGIWMMPWFHFGRISNCL